MNIKKHLSISIILALLLSIMLPITVAAYVEEMEDISITNISVFKDLAETDDYLVVFHYNMPFTSDNYSSTPASRSIEFTLLDDTGELIQTGKPYVYSVFESNGYGNGVGSFYFDADTAPTWESETVIGIKKLPGFFTSANTTSITITATDYSTVTGQENNRNALKEWVLLKCDDLESVYSDTGVVLKASSDSGIILSGFGETYFRGAINGLQDLCPGLFFIQTLVPESYTDATTYNMTLQDTYTDRLAGDDLGEGVENMALLFGGLSTGAFWGLAVFALTIGLSIYGQRKGWGAEIGIVCGLICTAGLGIIIGDALFIIIVAGAFIAGAGIVYLLILRRA